MLMKPICAIHGRYALPAALSLLTVLGARVDAQDSAQALREAAEALIAERDALRHRVSSLEARRDARPVREITETIVLGSGETLENVTLKWTGRKPAPREPGKLHDFVVMVEVRSNDPENPAVIRNVTFDSAYPQHAFGGIRAIQHYGKGLLIEDVTFEASVDEDGRLTPVLEHAFLVENTASDVTMRRFEIKGTQGYGLWLGPVIRFLAEDGKIGPSSNEHCIRGRLWQDVTLRRITARNHSKSPLWLMDGQTALIEDCNFTNEVRIGPLDKGRHPAGQPDLKTREVTVRNTVFNDRLEIKHGTERVTLHDGRYGSIKIESNDAAEFARHYDKPAKDIHFKGRTHIVIDKERGGEGLVVQNGVTWGVEHLDVEVTNPKWTPTGWNNYAFRVPSLEPIEKLTLPPSPAGAWPRGGIGIIGNQPVTIEQVKKVKADALSVREAR